MVSFKGWLLTESKQNIINLRYPEIIAKLLYEKFGENAPLIAKWFREYKFSRDEIPDNWWLQATGDYRQTPSLYDLTILHAATDSPENYVNAIDKLELSSAYMLKSYDETSLQEQKKALKVQIGAKFFDDTFFNYSFTKDIKSGKLKDIAPYKHLKFWDAQHKYDEKNIFHDKTPLKTYKNGFKWIDVGKRCILVGHLMKNCGSAGLMSWDNDATIIALFGPGNTAHVVVTYSPNEKRISGDEGVASTEVKSKYHAYILDLTKILGATFDAHKSRSRLLKVKYLLQGKATDIRQIQMDSVSDDLFMFKIQGKTYYANAYVMVSKEDMEKVQDGIKQGTVSLENNQRSMIQNMFNHRNQPILAHFGVKYIPLNQI